MMRKGVPVEKLYSQLFKKKTYEFFVEEEIRIFEETQVEIMVASPIPTCRMSTRILNLPLTVLISGTLTPPFFKSGFASFPENYENIFTKLLPSSIKNQFTKWYLLNNKLLVKNFKRIARKYNVQPFRSFNDLHLGDHSLIGDDINFLGVTPTEEFPLKNYIGPIAGDLFGRHQKEVDDDIQEHLKKPGKSILLIMGSYCEKLLFLKILDTLNQTNHNIIAVYTSILEKEELPKTNENILLKKFIPTPIVVNKMVDLAIIHGGRGTAYTAAYSGKPVIGIPIFIEHQYNIDNLVRHGTAIRISKKFFKPQELFNAITTIFNNYNTYLINAQQLAGKLTKEPGEIKAVERLIEIVISNVKK